MTHPPSLALRRLGAGEQWPEAFAVQGHLEQCDACRAAVQSFRDEQTEFEKTVSFERFAAGVEHAVAVQRQRESRARSARGRWWPAAASLAAMLAIAVGVQQLASRAQAITESPNRVKGGASVDFVVAGAGGQRQVTAEPEALGANDRVRVGVRPGAWRYALVVSVDDRGTVTPIYVDHGHSLSVPPGTTWLPDSLEFTGAGLERVIVVLSPEPLPLEAVSRAVKTAYDAAHQDVAHLNELDLPGEQIQRTFLKP